MKASPINKLVRTELQNVCTSISLRSDVFTARTPFKYRDNKAVQQLAEKITSRLQKQGIDVEIVDSGDYWAITKPKAPLSKNSHLWVKFKVK